MIAARRLEGRVALITGGSRGIGRAVCVRLAAEGAAVVVNFATAEQAAREVIDGISSRGGTAIALRADVAEEAEVRGMVTETIARFGRLDVLVNNAAICPFGDFLEISAEQWDRVQAVNLRGTFLCSQAAARDMVARGTRGRIIAISSIAALFGGGPLQTHYAVTKAGQVALVRSLANVLGPHGITCNAVLPGTIATDINRDFLASADRVSAYTARIPAGRIGEPDDVAGTVAFLASDDAAYVNGAAITVDGGALARRV